MKLFRVLRSMVSHADFFSTTELIRYREEPDFKTFTGGIFSLAIIILLTVIFSSMSMSAVNREHIDWASQTLKDSVPPALELPFNTFNIGVELQGFNLSSPIQYFDVVMTLFEFKGKILDSTTQIPMSTCRRIDWALNEDILGNFDRMNATNWLCPDVKDKFYVQGKWASDYFTFLSIDVLKCGSVNKNATCASPEQIDRVLSNIVHYSVYYINALVAPENKQCISYYMEDKDYIYFGKNLGSANYIFISDYDVTTDYSILPYTDKNTITGGVVMLPTTISIQEVANGWYGSFIFRKSANSYTFTRSFTKFDTVISYIGGLFGAIVGILFLMNHYTRTNFEICLGSSTYDDEDDQSLVIKSMNFCTYIGYVFYLCLNAMGFKPQWPTFDRFHKCRVQIQKHLDIKLILDKLNFLERAVCTICKEDRYRALHLRSKMTINEAEKLREFYSLRPQIISTILRRKKQGKIKEELRELQRVEQSLASPSEFKQSPFPIFNRNKVKPEDILPDMISDNVAKEPQKSVIEQNNNEEMNSSQSNNTMKFTKNTRRYVLQNKSNLSDQASNHEHIEEDILMPNIVSSLIEVWREALQGDNFSQEIWNSLDNDVRVILQRKIEKDEDRVIDMDKSQVSDEAESEPDKERKVKWQKHLESL